MRHFGKEPVFNEEATKAPTLFVFTPISPQGDTAMKISELMDTFLAESKAERSVYTVAKYAERLRYFRLFCEENEIEQPNELTAGTIKAYQDYLNAKNLATNTLHVYIDTTQKFLSFLFNRHYVFVDLSMCLTRPKWEKKPRKKYSTAQVAKLLESVDSLDALKARNKAILALFLNEGLSTGELERLSLIDCDLTTKELRLVKKKRFVGMCEQSEKLLKAYLKKRAQLNPKVDWLFVRQDGQKLSGQGVGLVVRKARK